MFIFPIGKNFILKDFANITSTNWIFYELRQVSIVPFATYAIRSFIYPFYCSNTSSPNLTFIYSLIASTHFSNPSFPEFRHRS